MTLCFKRGARGMYTVRGGCWFDLGSQASRARRKCSRDYSSIILACRFVRRAV